MNTASKHVRSSLKRLKPYQPGKPIEEVQRELGLSRIVKLASNEYPEGPSPEVLEAIHKELAELHRYPEATCYELSRAVCEVYDIGENEVVFGNGANELLEILFHVFNERGEGTVIHAHPSFPIYSLLGQSHFESSRPVALNSSGVHDLEAMAAAIDETTRLIFICNPNNPTGTYVADDALRRFLKSVRDDIVIVLDEAYVEFVTAPDFPDFFALRKLHPGLLSLRSFSKSYSLAGLRVGYLMGDAELIGLVQRARQPFNVNRLAQRAASVAIRQRERVESRRLQNRVGLEFLRVALEELGCQLLPSQTNFLLATVENPPPDMFDRFLAEGVIVRPMGGFGLESGSFRVNVGTPDENQFFRRRTRQGTGKAGLSDAALLSDSSHERRTFWDAESARGQVGESPSTPAQRTGTG